MIIDVIRFCQVWLVLGGWVTLPAVEGRFRWKDGIVEKLDNAHKEPENKGDYTEGQVTQCTGKVKKGVECFHDLWF